MRLAVKSNNLFRSPSARPETPIRCRERSLHHRPQRGCAAFRGKRPKSPQKHALSGECWPSCGSSAFWR